MLEILDGEGRLVRTLRSELDPPYTPSDHPDWDPKEERKPALTVKPGLNRASWDLTYEKARWVPGTRNEAGGRGPGPRALPGEYTLRLIAGGSPSIQTLRMEADPASTRITSYNVCYTKLLRSGRAIAAASRATPRPTASSSPFRLRRAKP